MCTIKSALHVLGDVVNTSWVFGGSVRRGLSAQILSLLLVLAVGAFALSCKDSDPAVGGDSCVGPEGCEEGFVCDDGECVLEEEKTPPTKDGDPKESPSDDQYTKSCESSEDCGKDLQCITTNQGKICTRRCSAEGNHEDCEGGDLSMECLMVAPDGGNLISICYPRSETYCEPCTRREGDVTGTCGAPGKDLCVRQNDGDFCAVHCDSDNNCEEDASCETVMEGGEEYKVCVPTSGYCLDCIDADGDGYGIEGYNSECPYPNEVDCDDNDSNVYPGAPNMCDGKDTNCAGRVDDTYRNEDGVYDGDAHCGECGHNCHMLPHVAASSCAVGADGAECVIEECQAGWGDCDGDPRNGCEKELVSTSDCGTCGNDCRAVSGGTYICEEVQAGAPYECVLSYCDDGWLTCAGAEECATAANAPETCGSCSNNCTLLPHVEVATCEDVSDTYQCGIAQCAEGYSDCNSNVDDGCEVDITTIANCGACGNTCDVPNAVNVCDAGTCDIDGCETGWVDRAGGVCNYQCTPGLIAIGPGGGTTRPRDRPGDTTTPGYNWRNADTNCDGIDGDIERAIFVDTVSGSDLNDGTFDAPVATIGRAIQIASPIDRNQIYISKGVYDEALELSSGVSLYGGYDAAPINLSDGTFKWTRGPGNVVTIRGEHTTVSKHRIGLVGENITDTTYVQNVTVESADATDRIPTLAGDGKNGASSYAFHCVNCTGLRIVGSTMSAGKGAPGAAGSNGQQQYTSGNLPTSCKGARGGDGRGGHRGQGGAGGSPLSCSLAGAGSSYSGGRGGTAGYRRNEGGDPGLPGQLGSNGGVAGTGGAYKGDGGAGGVGSAGNPGNDPTNSANAGSLAGYFWTGNSGNAGTVGTVGHGGGGGGGGGGRRRNAASTKYGGGGGGGGGAGGCPGTGGDGGGAGGASVAVALFESNGATLTNVTLRSDTGGAGGRGGVGGAGGPGCPGGNGGLRSNSAGDGGKGGDGAPGGRGGHGAGGSGGASWGLLLKDTAATVNSPIHQTGHGGTPGASNGHAGQPGVSSDQVSF